MAYAPRPSTTAAAKTRQSGWSRCEPPLKVLAPALALPKYPQSSPVIGARYTRIIHGWDDDVVPVMPVLELAREQRLETLVMPDGHRLENSIDRVAREFHRFLETCLKNPNKV